MEGFTQKGNILSHDSGQFRIRERKGRCYEVEFVTRPGTWISTGTRSFDEAVAFSFKALASNGRMVSSKGSKLSDYGDVFFGTVEKSILRSKNERFGKFYTNECYEQKIGLYRNYIRPAFGEMDPKRITDIMVENWYLSLVGIRDGVELGATSKLMALDAMNQLMRELKRQGVIQSNPCDTVDRLRASDKTPREPFFLDEIQKFFPAERDELLKIWRNLKWALYFSIMADTGWRPGEVMGLSKSSLDASGGLYQKESVNSKTRKIKKSIKTTNTGKKYKIGTLSDYTISLLDDYLPTVNGEYLFMDFDGTFPDTGYANRVLDEAMKHAGIPKNSPTTGRPRTAYGFRHFFSTYMHDHRGVDGISEEDISEMMAHTGYRPEYDHRTAQMMIFRLTNKTKNVINAIREEKPEDTEKGQLLPCPKREGDRIA